MDSRQPSAPAKRRRNAPTKREVALAEAISTAANDLAKASNYAETYMARVALGRAMRALQEWALKGRPHV